MISYVGFQQREYRVNNGDSVSISLSQVDARMDTAEVVINTGYQQILKEGATGSFTYLDNKTFNRRIGATVLDRLGDLVPGLLKVNRGTGSALDDYVIRGISAINAETKPLLVIDNYIYDGDPNLLNSH
jgi:hypothetical protein